MAFGFFSNNISQHMIFNIIEESLDGVINLKRFGYV